MHACVERATDAMGGLVECEAPKRYDGPDLITSWWGV